MCLRMAMSGYGQMEFFLNMPLDELLEIVKEVSQIVKEQRVRIGHKNRR